MKDLDATLREGISGMWHYHLSRNGVALCGNLRTMATGAPRETWGHKSGHMITSYCKDCSAAFDAHAGEER